MQCLMFDNFLLGINIGYYFIIFAKICKNTFAKIVSYDSGYYRREKFY